MRPRCPFYGFEWVTGLELLGPLLDDAGDNRCGLMFDLNVPCMRQQAGRDADMDSCRLARAFRRLEDRPGSWEHVTFYPREHPEGIRCPAWRDEVLAAADRAAQERAEAMRKEARAERGFWLAAAKLWPAVKVCRRPVTAEERERAHLMRERIYQAERGRLSGQTAGASRGGEDNENQADLFGLTGLWGLRGLDGDRATVDRVVWGSGGLLYIHSHSSNRSTNTGN